MVAGTQGNRYVFAVIDHYSHYVKFFALRSKNTEVVCKAFSQ